MINRFPNGTYTYGSSYGLVEVIKINYYLSDREMIRATLVNVDKVSEFRTVKDIREVVSIELLVVF